MKQLPVGATNNANNVNNTDNAPIRVPQWAYPAVTIASLLLGIEAIVRGTSAVHVIGDSDLTNFFFKSATYILNGDPWHMYAVRASGAYPNYNPPLSIALMAPLLALAHTLGFDKNFGEVITFVCIPFMVFVPLLGYLVLRTLRYLYPQIPEAQQFLAYALVVLSPLTWQSYGTWYHIEQPMMLCFLVGAIFAFQQRRETLAGLLAGLALMTRTTALIPLIGFGVLLILGREWRALFKLVGMAVLVVAVVLGPFFFFDRADTTYSFISWRGTASIGGNSIWSIFAASDTTTGIRHTLDATARRLDMPTVVLFVAVVTFLAFRRWRISAYGRDAWAVLALSALAVPMLSKTNWPYYYLEPFILLIVWEFTSLHDRRAGVWRWPIVSISFLATAATLSQYIGLQSVGTLDRISVGLLEFAMMLAFVILIWLRLQAAKVASTPQPTQSTYGQQVAAVAASQSGFHISNRGQMPTSTPPSLQMPQMPSPQQSANSGALPARGSTSGNVSSNISDMNNLSGTTLPPQRSRPTPPPQQHLVSPASRPLDTQSPQTQPPASFSTDWPDLSPAPGLTSGPMSGNLSNTPQMSPHDLPPWQDGNAVPLTHQWPDLGNAINQDSNWPSLAPQSPPIPPQTPAQQPPMPPDPSRPQW